MSTKEIYTIGYSCFKIDEFIQVLKNYKINCVIDVRSIPMSKFHMDYNSENLYVILKKNKILYRNYKEEFGARQIDHRYYRDNLLDFNMFTKSDKFREGLNKVEAGTQLNYTFALMCAEKDPGTCHRSIMIGKEFSRIGYLVKHILSDKSYETQNDLEKRLVNYYFPNRAQMTLFNDELSWDEMVEKSYEFKNNEIGFKEIDEVNHE